MATHNVRQLWQMQLPHMLAMRNEGVEIFFKRVSPPVGSRGSAIKVASKRSRTVTCVDGRCWHGCRQAGAGLLLSDQQFEKLVEERGIETIATHAECGAARIAFRGTDPEEAIQKWGAERAKKFGLRHVHQGADQIHRVQLGEEHLNCPRGFHPEVVIYFDGTGCFRRIKTLPLGFAIDRKHSPYAQHELTLSMKIGLENGFGDIFSADMPMRIISIADSNAMLERMKCETQRAVSQLSARDSRKFVSDSVLVSIPQCNTSAATA